MATANGNSVKQQLAEASPLFWHNPACAPCQPAEDYELEAASSRLERCAPLLAELFSELVSDNGLIESPLLELPTLKQQLGIAGRLLLKADHALPIAGSVKARGGFHEVLCHAEQLALSAGLLRDTADDYRRLASDEARRLFAKHRLVVASTGNLRLSIGMIGAALGFRTQVHMSSDAKAWKKKRLRDRGVEVIEHDSDYSAAVASGRAATAADPLGYFVDDENSPRLFFGYAVAALRLKRQLDEAGIRVDADHPLLVYIPCGVGGAPGGICYGLRRLFGDAVHCYFAEPVAAPSVLLGLLDPSVPSVYDIGLDCCTEADGLAVGRASEWVCETVRSDVDGVFTVSDESLFRDLYQLYRSENIAVEPSAAAGIQGPARLMHKLSEKRGPANLHDRMEQATHIVWSTGGRLVPDNEFEKFLKRGKIASKEIN